MDIALTRITDERHNQLEILLPEGSIVIRGTGGFVTGTMRALLTPPSIVRALIFEHINPQEFYDGWDEAAREAGLELSD